MYASKWGSLPFLFNIGYKHLKDRLIGWKAKPNIAMRNSLKDEKISKNIYLH